MNQQAFDYLKKVEDVDKEMISRFKKITDKCVDGQLKIFDKLNIHFDVFTHESDFVYNNYLEDILNKLEKAKKLHEDEFCRLYVDLTGYNIPTKSPVIVLTRSNKTSLYSDVINELLRSNEPAHLTKYIFNVAGLFSKLYEQVNISNETDIVLKSSRIRLLNCISKVITSALKVLGIETIEKL